MNETSVISLKGKKEIYGPRLEKDVAEDIVYVGRSFKFKGWDLDESPYHNPKLELAEYEKYIINKLDNDPELYESLISLKGKRLACWCVTKTNTEQCHAVILKKIIEKHNIKKNKGIILHEIKHKIDNDIITDEQLQKILNILTPDEPCLKYKTIKHCKIADVNLFDISNKNIWMEAYRLVQNNRLKPGYYNYSRKLIGTPNQQFPTVHVVKRVRGGESYKNIKLKDIDGNPINANDIFWVPVSKGYSFSDLSPYVIGPIPSHGINILNATCSKVILSCHLNGKFDLSRNNFWKKNNHAHDEGAYNIESLLENDVWYNEWKKWSDHVALCGESSSHWTDDMGKIIAYVKVKPDNVEDLGLDSFFYNKEDYHRNTYENWLIESWENIEAFKYLYKRFNIDKIHIALVHPVVSDAHDMSIPITISYMNQWISNNNLMNDPMLLAMKLIK